MAQQRFIGLISGTSMDGIDAALVSTGAGGPTFLDGLFTPYPAGLRQALDRAIAEPGAVTTEQLGGLDVRIGECFANAVVGLLKKTGTAASDIIAIGSHGQTVFHRVDMAPRFSLQIGDPNIIVARTGITTVADFRRRDIALGGQGAPLMPAFHRAVFASPSEDRAVANIGGIANLTWLPADGMVAGFDTGPGNALMDLWCARHFARDYDRNGAIGATGTVISALLESCLSEPYFTLPAPKSTGRELFNLAWLAPHLGALGAKPDPADVLSTLCELTATTLAKAITDAGACRAVYVCGGGAHNDFLMQRLGALLPGRRCLSTIAAGLHPDWVEACGFAWLAGETLASRPGNLPAVTGATAPAILGAIYPA